jgi:glycosyltransferase involved in cell wall biosynthesis
VKIAFLNIYNGLIDRGAETFVKEVAGRFSEKHEVVVFQSGAARGDEKYKVQQIPLNINWKSKDAGGTITRKLFIDHRSRLIFKFGIKSIPGLWRGKFDIVIPVNGGWLPAIGRIFTWVTGAKLVITGQSGIGWDDRNNLWCFPDTFIALSSYAQKWAKRANPFVKVATIPNGVDTEKFSPEGERLKTHLKRPVIVCAAALTPSKRIDLAVKAVSKLEKVSLLVVGDGDLKDDIKALGKKMLGKRFDLTVLPFEKMPQVYRLADVFTLPSEAYYSFEIVLVEAMSVNVPVVANDDPIRRGIVAEAGLFVDPADIDAYAKALEKALKLNWGDKPRSRAEKFDWDKIALQYEKVFSDLKK